MTPKPTRLFIQLRLIEELDLHPGRKMSYKAYRSLDRRDLTDVPDVASGDGWLNYLEDHVSDTLASVSTFDTGWSPTSEATA